MKKYIYTISILFSLVLLGSCNDFLDRQPLDQVTPEVYFKNESDLESYSINLYLDLFPNHGTGYGLGSIITGDQHTDNMVTSSGSTSRWAKNWRVPESGGNYSFTIIRRINFLMDRALPLWKNNSISGNVTNINHYMGEMYMMRAYEYFNKLKTFGDFPIVRHELKDDKASLIASSKRAPRNQVARFIISDLDSAIMLLQPEFKSKRRITQAVAQLLKSRVALYEASWLKYHKGTPHVPGGTGWPGASADYNSGFTIDIDAELNYFADEAMKAAKAVDDFMTSKGGLTANNGVMVPTISYNAWNPYFNMFALPSMADNAEVLMWREYSAALSLRHSVSVYIRAGGDNGLTRAMIESFVMKNGLPIYAGGSGYHGDVSIDNAKKDRDERLQLFVFGESDYITLENLTDQFYTKPTILEQVSHRDVTGYRNRKFFNYDPSQNQTSGTVCTYGCPIFRGAEALLNYMEACYIKNGSLDATAVDYWRRLRARAGVDQDYMKTVNATDLSKENDWAVYSAGAMIDPLLYNIRRERRCELMSEGFRYDDLKRWRALDQVQNSVVEGFNLWDNAYTLYTGANEKLIQPGEAGTPNVSAKATSKYLRPYQIVTTNNDLFNGYTWMKGYYLSPIPAFEIRISASNMDDPSTSPLYQNPYWPTQANGSATE